MAQTEPEMDGAIDIDLSAVRRRLEQRWAELSGVAVQVEARLRRSDGSFPDDWPERASVVAGDEVLEAIEGSGRAGMEEIRAAIARIDAGVYGACTSCGAPVAPGRLLALPWAADCVPCAEQADRQDR